MPKLNDYQHVTAQIFTYVIFAIASVINSSELKAQTSEPGLRQLMLEIRNAELKCQRMEDRLEEIKKDRVSSAKRLAELREQREKGLKQQDKIGVSADSYSTIITTLQSKRVDLLVDIAGMEARENTIKKIRREMEAGGADVISQLEKLVEIQKSNLQSVAQRYKVASASKSEVNAAESKLLEIEIRLTEAKRQSKSSALLDDIFVKSTLDHAEKKARLEMTESLLNSFAQSRKNLEQQIALRQELDQATINLKKQDSEILLGESEILRRKLQIEDLKSKLKASTEKDENDN